MAEITDPMGKLRRQAARKYSGSPHIASQQERWESSIPETAGGLLPSSRTPPEAAPEAEAAPAGPPEIAPAFGGEIVKGYGDWVYEHNEGDIYIRWNPKRQAERTFKVPKGAGAETGEDPWQSIARELTTRGIKVPGYVRKAKAPPKEEGEAKSTAKPGAGAPMEAELGESVQEPYAGVEPDEEPGAGAPKPLSASAKAAMSPELGQASVGERQDTFDIAGAFRKPGRSELGLGTRDIYGSEEMEPSPGDLQAPTPRVSIPEPEEMREPEPAPESEPAPQLRRAWEPVETESWPAESQSKAYDRYMTERVEENERRRRALEAKQKAASAPHLKGVSLAPGAPSARGAGGVLHIGDQPEGTFSAPDIKAGMEERRLAAASRATLAAAEAKQQAKLDRTLSGVGFAGGMLEGATAGLIDDPTRFAASEMGGPGPSRAPEGSARRLAGGAVGAGAAAGAGAAGLKALQWEHPGQSQSAMKARMAGSAAETGRVLQGVTQAEEAANDAFHAWQSVEHMYTDVGARPPRPGPERTAWAQASARLKKAMLEASEHAKFVKLAAEKAGRVGSAFAPPLKALGSTAGGMALAAAELPFTAGIAYSKLDEPIYMLRHIAYLKKVPLQAKHLDPRSPLIAFLQDNPKAREALLREGVLGAAFFAELEGQAP